MKVRVFNKGFWRQSWSTRFLSIDGDQMLFHRTPPPSCASPSSSAATLSLPTLISSLTNNQADSSSTSESAVLVLAISKLGLIHPLDINQLGAASPPAGSTTFPDSLAAPLLLAEALPFSVASCQLESPRVQYVLVLQEIGGLKPNKRQFVAVDDHSAFIFLAKQLVALRDGTPIKPAPTSATITETPGGKGGGDTPLAQQLPLSQSPASKSLEHSSTTIPFPSASLAAASSSSLSSSTAATTNLSRHLPATDSPPPAPPHVPVSILDPAPFDLPPAPPVLPSTLNFSAPALGRDNLVDRLTNVSLSLSSPPVGAPPGRNQPPTPGASLHNEPWVWVESSDSDKIVRSATFPGGPSPAQLPPLMPSPTATIFNARVISPSQGIGLTADAPRSIDSSPPPRRNNGPSPRCSSAANSPPRSPSPSSRPQTAFSSSPSSASSTSLSSSGSRISASLQLATTTGASVAIGSPNAPATSELLGMRQRIRDSYRLEDGIWLRDSSPDAPQPLPAAAPSTLVAGWEEQWKTMLRDEQQKHFYSIVIGMKYEILALGHMTPEIMNSLKADELYERSLKENISPFMWRDWIHSIAESENARLSDISPAHDARSPEPTPPTDFCEFRCRTCTQCNHFVWPREEPLFPPA